MATRQKPALAAPPPSDTPSGDWQMQVRNGADALDSLPDEDEPEQTASDRVMSMIGELPDDERAVVKVYRKTGINGRTLAWCDDYSPADFEAGGLGMIRQKYGAGDFQVCLYGTVPGTKRYTIRARSDIHVDASATALATGTPSPQNDAMRMLMEGQAAMLKALTERPAAPDPMEQMRNTLALMTTMREAFGLTAPATPPKSSIAEMVDAIKELRAAGELVNPPPEDDSLVGMVKSMLPMVTQAMQARQAPSAEPSPFPPIGHLPAIGAVNDEPAGAVAFDPAHPDSIVHELHGAPPATSGATDMPIMSPEMAAALKLKAYVAALVAMAMANTDPEVGAEVVYEKLPDEWIDLLELPNWWPLFSAQVPAVAPHEAWFTKVRDRALAMFNEQPADTESGVHEGGPGAAP